jgi:hypothetical protein
MLCLSLCCAICFRMCAVHAAASCSAPFCCPLAPATATAQTNDLQQTFHIVSGTIGALIIVLFAVLLIVIQEPVQILRDMTALVPGLKRAWFNRPFQVLLTTMIIGSIAHHCGNLMLVCAAPPPLSSLYFTLLHFTSLYFTLLHFTSLHFTSRHFTSLHFTSLHSTSLHFTPLHFTSLHFASYHFSIPLR